MGWEQRVELLQGRLWLRRGAFRSSCEEAAGLGAIRSLGADSQPLRGAPGGEAEQEASWTGAGGAGPGWNLYFRAINSPPAETKRKG